MPFVFEGYENSAPSKDFVFEGYAEKPKKKEEPLSLKGSAKAYGAGFAGGAGGIIPDIAKTLKPLSPASPGIASINQLLEQTGALDTQQITRSLSGKEPQNALERILEQSGQFGGIEGLLGAGLGGAAGPAGAAIGAGAGALHGSASGALYGGLKELGMDDTWALGVTALATLSPIAFQKIWPKLASKFKPGTSFQEALQSSYKEREAITSGKRKLPAEAPVSKESELINKIMGDNVPASQFETAEQALKEIGGEPKEMGTSPEGLGLEVLAPATETSKPIEGVVEKASGPGASISPVEFESEASGGKALNTTIRDQAAEGRKEVSAAYKEAEENYQNINSIGDELLIDDLRKEADKIRESASPNTAEAAVLKKIDEISSNYINHNHMPVRTLIRTSDSISGMANYELPFTGPKDILKKVANSMDRAAIRAIENNGGNADLQRLANKKYGEWANRFANDEISPFLEKTVNNPESLFRKSISDEGSFRAVESALHDSKRSKEFTDALARKVAENKMGKFKADQIGGEKYNEALRNLKALIGEKRTQAYDKALREMNRIPRPRVEVPSARESAAKLKPRITSVPKSVKVAEKIAKYQKMTPEQLQSKLKSRSGIKELKKDLTPNSFDKLVKQEARSILHEGHIEREFTGDQLYKVLNNERNFEIFTEILGREEANALKEAAKGIGKENVNSGRIIDYFKVIAEIGVKATLGVKGYKLLRLLIR